MRLRGALLVLAVSLCGAQAFSQDSSLEARRGRDWSAELRKYWGTTFKVGGKGLPDLRADDIPGVPLPNAPRTCQWIKDRHPLDNELGLAAEADLGSSANPEYLIQCIVLGEDWTQDQRAIMAHIEVLGVSVGHLWLGSHVVVQGDSGAIYADWKRRGAVWRISSHYPGIDSQQFEIPFKRHALLFGKNGKGETWFQMENHAARNVVGKPGHFIDFIRLTLSKRNIGPLGSSNRTEKLPLIIPYRPD
jgi:hypothetical protein